MHIPTIEEIVRQDLEEFRSCKHKWNCSDCPRDLCVTVVSVAEFPSEYGDFRIIGFVNNIDGMDHTIVLKGDVGDGENILTRIHSACLTGDALGSRRCDCGPQLHEALRIIQDQGRGILLYHMAEGRGIGLANKLRAYALQDKGYDTLDANVMLGFKADERDYRIPAEMLKKIGVKSVILMTNNPEKMDGLARYGIRVTARRQHEHSVQEHNIKYLETKRERFGHLLLLDHTSDTRS
ncbi:MAG: GTP cyclohydrolase II [Spirochaetes bacterium]|nr:GTP cyclohydrolase II [Spirochaetota bacterium]